ncbi:hypothetical protein K458DRAFT_392090 [Lentithecium fluviatile CBS 122367]|uniref:Uncharacterized protein n=1 Tax=Lentithecium fluviatile CBS 122367 TaxID=1168545 RepID=A0A6G1ITJ3_9PLEO|nr:hypothetical protein K458DRAFT_392090 [Lentithecium fluviatile CBS 122367]
MSGPGDDVLADLTTAPIFDDAVYLSEALLLPVNESEDDLDAQLAMSARESGIEDPYRILCPDVHNLSTSLSTTSLQSEQRSSVSIHSRETHSTTFTSPTSRNSRDNAFTEQLPALRSPPSLARASMSLDHDSAGDRFPPGVRHRHSSSGYSAANSVLSTTSSARTPSTRKHMRASALFSLFRKDSSTPSPSRRGYQSKPQSPRLEPSRSLSKYSMRVHVRGATEDKDDISPSRSVKSPTRPTLRAGLTNEEIDSATNSALQSPGLLSLRDSGYSEDGVSPIELSHALDGNKGRQDSFPSLIPEMSHKDERDVHLALANEAFKSLKSEQRQQFQRVSLFESNQRKALSSYLQWSLKRLTDQLETSKAEKMKQHAVELDRLDERQINAEHELRKTHGTETQNVATALKYMDAYCSGAKPTDPEFAHDVTDEDRQKLARQRELQQKLPGKHVSAINVLRARQERDTQAKLQKQEAELRALDTQYEKDKRAEELQFMKDSSRLDKVIQGRRRRMIHRWDLKFEIWRKDWESQHGTTLNARLPHEDWPEASDLDSPITQSSSLAVYTKIAA